MIATDLAHRVRSGGDGCDPLDERVHVDPVGDVGDVRHVMADEDHRHPARRASRGDLKRTTSPSRRISPSSGTTAPERLDEARLAGPVVPDHGEDLAGVERSKSAPSIAE